MSVGIGKSRHIAVSYTHLHNSNADNPAAVNAIIEEALGGN